MMSNLFSIFDPSSSFPMFNNWLSSFIFILIIPVTFWIMPNMFFMLFNNLMNILHKEFKLLLGLNAMNGSTFMFISILIFIMLNNFMGLFPYIFTSTSHLVTNLSFAIPMWLAFMLFGWINHTNHMFIHLVPQNTPTVLMSFMVLIESISNIIRPGTLAVRLSANMIAGHLLMTLLGNQTSSSSFMIMSFLLLIQMLLLILESAVSIIQAYVFAVLTSLYSSEITN